MTEPPQIEMKQIDGRATRAPKAEPWLVPYAAGIGVVSLLLAGWKTGWDYQLIVLAALGGFCFGMIYGAVIWRRVVKDNPRG